MNKVTTINLNGRAYQLEEQGFEALRKYLETAAAKLAGNPDKDEIMADFEQAIADKCDQKLAGHKDVISEREIEEIIAAMGPVEGSDESSDVKNSGGNANGANGSTSSTNGANSSNASTPKRLFRIPQGEWIMGVCRGLGAYFNIDVTLVRIVFILLTIFTHAFWILAYIVLAVVMPVAKTEEEVAQAHGWSPTPPFNAHDFIEQAKARYGQLHDELQKMHDEHKAKNYGSTMNMNGTAADATAGAAGSAANVADAVDAAKAAGQTAKETGQKAKDAAQEWKHNFKQEMRQKKEQMKQEWRAQQRSQQRERHEARRAHDSQRYYAQDHNPGWIVSQVFLGIFSVIVSVAIAALAAAWIFAIFSLIKYGTIFGYAFGTGHPIWISIVFLTAAFYILVVPFSSFLHNAWGSTYYRDVRRGGGESFGRALLFIGVLVILFFTARELFPQVGTWWNTAVTWLNTRV